MGIDSVLLNKLCFCGMLAVASAVGQAVPPVGVSHTFNCPASVGGKGPAAKDHKFLRPSIYNGTAGKEEYDLAPDEEHSKAGIVTQVWKISDYQDSNVFVRCRYAGTSITVTKDLPVELKACTFRFRKVPGQQPIAEPWFECR